MNMAAIRSVPWVKSDHVHNSVATRVVNFAQGTLLMAAMFMAYWLHELGGLHPYCIRPSSPSRCSSWPAT